jgi:hypothetical protein
MSAAAGLRARCRGSPEGRGTGVGEWKQGLADQHRLDAAHAARQAREALGRLVFRALETTDRVQVVLCENGRPWVGGVTDRSAAKILAEHPTGLVGIYTRVCAWHDLMADLEEAGL